MNFQNYFLYTFTTVETISRWPPSPLRPYILYSFSRLLFRFRKLLRNELQKDKQGPFAIIRTARPVWVPRKRSTYWNVSTFKCTRNQGKVRYDEVTEVTNINYDDYNANKIIWIKKMYIFRKLRSYMFKSLEYTLLKSKQIQSNEMN